MLGVKYVVTHIGSHKGTGVEQGTSRVVEGVLTALDFCGSEAILLLENSAGSGNSIGSKFEQIRDILNGLTGFENRLGVCLDTAHLWGAGYDISTREAVTRTFDEFDGIVGLNRLKLLHTNDTKVALGAHVDRHANIGLGNIGEEGFRAIVNHPLLQHLAAIIETPPRDDDLKDIDELRRMRIRPELIALGTSGGCIYP